MRKTGITTLILSGVLLTALFSCNRETSKEINRELQVKGATLYYTEDIDSLEAMRLGDYLSVNDLFFDGRKKSIKLHKEGSRYIFMAPLDVKSANDSAFIISYSALARLISRDVFSYQPVDVYFTDEKFDVVRKVPYSKSSR